MEFNPRARRIDPAEPLADDCAKHFSVGCCPGMNVVMGL